MKPGSSYVVGTLADAVLRVAIVYGLPMERAAWLSNVPHQDKGKLVFGGRCGDDLLDRVLRRSGDSKHLPGEMSRRACILGEQLYIRSLSISDRLKAGTRLQMDKRARVGTDLDYA